MLMCHYGKRFRIPAPWFLSAKTKATPSEPRSLSVSSSEPLSVTALDWGSSPGRRLPHRLMIHPAHRARAPSRWLRRRGGGEIKTGGAPPAPRAASDGTESRSLNWESRRKKKPTTEVPAQRGAGRHRWPGLRGNRHRLHRSPSREASSLLLKSLLRYSGL